MAKKKKSSGNEIPAWVVTYGDLMSLLLCFFILIAAFSEMRDPDEFRKVLEKIKEALGFEGGLGIADISSMAANSNITVMTETRPGRDNQKQRNEAPDPNVSGNAPKATYIQDGEILAIGGALRFQAGSSRLSLDIEEKLRLEVAPKIRDKNYIVRIEGHSWGHEDATLGGHVHASFERAVAVYDYLVDECGIDNATLEIVAAADNQPSVESTGSDPSSNRRVQVYMTSKTLDDVVTDPYHTGRVRTP